MRRGLDWVSNGAGDRERVQERASAGEEGVDIGEMRCFWNPVMTCYAPTYRTLPHPVSRHSDLLYSTLLYFPLLCPALNSTVEHILRHPSRTKQDWTALLKILCYSTAHTPNTVTAPCSTVPHRTYLCSVRPRSMCQRGVCSGSTRAAGKSDPVPGRGAAPLSQPSTGGSACNTWRRGEEREGGREGGYRRRGRKGERSERKGGFLVRGRW